MKKMMLKPLLFFILLLAFVLILSACNLIPGLSGDTEPAHDAEIRGVYELYVENMNATNQAPLTYEQWLSMIRGEDGKDGADGKSPFIGENGNWWIGDVDTGVRAAGRDGQDGRGISLMQFIDGDLWVYYTDGTSANLGKITSNISTSLSTTVTTSPSTTAPVTTSLSKIDGIIDFDFEGADLSEYISISRDDYFGLAVTIDKIPEITQKDVDDYINKIRLYYSESTPQTDGVIAKNDTAKVFYRGQVEVNGQWVDFVGGSNLGSSATSLVIGSNQFIEGFEAALEGREFTNSKLTTFTGKDKVVGKDGLPVVFLSYSYKYIDKNNREKKGTFIDRISLEKDAEGNYVETQRYSAALRDALLGNPNDEDKKNTIGTTLGDSFTESFDITGDLVPETVTLTNVKITGIVKEDTPFVFEVAFPAEYPNNEALAGKTAKWYVYVSALSRPTIPTVNYDFVNGKLGLTYADLLDYIPEGTPVDSTVQQKAAVVAAFPHYVKAYLEENRTRSLTEAVMGAYWKAVIDKVEVKAWPENLVEDATLMLRNQVVASYVAQYGYSSSVTLEEYIVEYFGEEYFSNGEDSIDEGLDAVAQEYIKQEMLYYYILDEENLNLSHEERTKGYEERVQEMLDYYNAQYGTAGTVNELTEEDLAAAGYTKDVILSQMLHEKVCNVIYEEIQDLVIQK